MHDDEQEFNMSIEITKLRFNQCVRVNEGGSIFLGYAYAEVKSGDLHIGMPDLQVRLTVSGEPRVDFPTDLKKIDGEEKRVARYFTASKGSREALTRAVFATPEVSNAVDLAERKRSAA